MPDTVSWFKLKSKGSTQIVLQLDPENPAANGVYQDEDKAGLAHNGDTLTVVCSDGYKITDFQFNGYAAGVSPPGLSVEIDGDAFVATVTDISQVPLVSATTRTGYVYTLRLKNKGSGDCFTVDPILGQDPSGPDIIRLN